MKKVFWINLIIFTAILLLLACKKEKPSPEIVYNITHWPVVKTLEVTNVDSTTAKLTGIVNGNGLSTTVTFEYGTTTSYGNSVTAIQSPVTGDSITHVSADILGLTPYSTYHFRVKAENSLWIDFYSSEEIFNTNPTVTDIDSNIYHTLKIGSQVWMRENLKTTRYSNGDLIGTTTDISGESTSKYQWPCNNDENYVATYGRYYTWYAVTDIRNVCPTGWHVPSDDEWRVLTNYLGGEVVAGGKLKESGTSHWLSPNLGWQQADTTLRQIDATNESGFTALPAGVRFNTGHFQFLGELTYWWTSTGYYQSIAAIYWYLEYYNGLFLNLRSNKADAFSVRCIKDN